MNDAPSVFALLVFTGTATLTAIFVAQQRSRRQGLLVIAAALALLAVSFVLAISQNTGSDVLRVFTLRSAVEPTFVAGYVWGEEGLLLGGILGMLVVYGRGSRGRHDA
jgi:hypothetical protein